MRMRNSRLRPSLAVSVTCMEIVLSFSGFYPRRNRRVPLGMSRLFQHRIGPLLERWHEHGQLVAGRAMRALLWRKTVAEIERVRLRRLVNLLV